MLRAVGGRWWCPISDPRYHNYGYHILWMAHTWFNFTQTVPRLSSQNSVKLCRCGFINSIAADSLPTCLSPLKQRPELSLVFVRTVPSFWPKMWQKCRRGEARERLNGNKTPPAQPQLGDGWQLVFSNFDINVCKMIFTKFDMVPTSAFSIFEVPTIH